MNSSLIRTTRLVAENGLYEPISTGGGGGGITQLTGDVLAGPGVGSQPATVVRINGATVPAAGALTTGLVLQVSGPASLTYGLVGVAFIAPGVNGQFLQTEFGGTTWGPLNVASITPGANGQFLQTSGGVAVWGAAPGVTFPLFAPDGAPAGPEYSFAAQHGTGMYRDTASGDVRFAVAGNYVAGIMADGTIEGFQHSSYPFTLGLGGGIGTFMFVAGNIGGPTSKANLIATQDEVYLNAPTATFGFALHLQVDGADFVQCGASAGAPDEVSIGTQANSNIMIGAAIFSNSFGSGKGIIADVNTTSNLNIGSAVNKGVGYLWTDTRTDGQPSGFVFLGTGGAGGLGNGARSAMAPCGLGAINSQAGDEICERAYGRTTVGSTNTTTKVIPLENGTLNGEVRITGRLVSTGVGGGTVGDSYFGTFILRTRTIGGAVTVSYFAVDGAGTNGTDASMAGAVFSATPSGSAVAIEIDATGIASSTGSIEDWQVDLFKAFVN